MNYALETLTRWAASDFHQLCQYVS